MFKWKKEPEERYRHVKPGGGTHYKWDQVGLGPHESSCPSCKYALRLVHWTPTGEKRNT